MTTRGKIISTALIAGLLLLMLALFRSCTVSDTQVNTGTREPASLRVSAPYAMPAIA